MSTSAAANAQAFAAWAQVYDTQTNPLLALEQRWLPPLLPSAKGRYVLDAGCGSGRWLASLERAEPASLLGLDGSLDMLEVAARRSLPTTQLIHADLPRLPLAAASVDLALASFVLSYVDDLDLCASELARVIPSGGDLFLSDMHPATAAALGWRRGFDADGHSWRLTVHTRSLAEISGAFRSRGFDLAACLEPPFGEEERSLFLSAGKETAWHQAAGHPAIYILHFRRSENQTSTPSPAITLHGAECALGSRERLPASITLAGGAIASLIGTPAPASSSTAAHALDLSGYLLFPGLLNAHDHLEFALFPRLGSPPYANATQWALDIQRSERETITLHKSVPKETRLWWGGLRNLLCGATTVCEHNPLDPVLLSPDFPVRVVRNYAWAHSLAFATDLSVAFAGTPNDRPFLIHACEGIDRTAAQELGALEAAGAIDDRTVLVHGLALNLADSALLNARGAALITCPSSNSFLFGRTPTRELLGSIDRLALGSDSPLTANGDLLDEIRFASTVCRLSPDDLYAMVTRSAADILHLQSGEGSLRPGAGADLIAIRRPSGSPAGILASLSWRDIELVILAGRVHLASAEIHRRLPSNLSRGLAPLVIEDELRWLRAPIPSLLRAAEQVLGSGNLRLGGLRVGRAQE